MADDIRIRIGLEGDEDIKKKLEGVRDVGKKTGDEISKSLNTSKDVGNVSGGSKPQSTSGRNSTPHSELVPTPRRLGDEINSEESSERNRVAVERLRETLHVLHPALADAGIGVGELGGIARASRGGIIALAASIGTLLVASLERAGDAANEAAAKLGAFSAKGFAGGKEQFSALSETAGQLQTPTSELVDPFLQATRLNQSQPEHSQVQDKDLLEVVGTIVKAGKSENNGDASKVLEEAAKFFSQGREKGVFGPDDFKALAEIAPRFAAAVEDHLPKGTSGVFTGSQVLGAIRSAAPQIDANALAAQAAQPESISAAWVKVKAAYERFEENAPHGDAIAQGLDKLADFFTFVGDARKRTKDAAEKEANGPHNFDTPKDDLVSAIHRRITDGRSDPDTKGNSFTAYDAENTGKLTPAANDAAAALDKLTESASAVGPELSKKLEEFNLKPEDAFKVESADLGFKKAKLEAEFEPAESASKLERDKIAVESAGIHLEQAKISGLDAQKNLSLSRLAPEEARERLESAESRRDSALSKFYKNRGVDTSQLDAINAQGADQRELDAAETALKRAKLEQKYAYLEEPKADLAAHQSEIAIKSAGLEQGDSSLKLAKDSAGQPLEHGYAQLRYAEASLEESKEQTKYQKNLELLKEILKKLEGGGAGSSSTKESSPTTDNSSSKLAGTNPLSKEEFNQRVPGFGPGAGELLHPGGVRDITNEVIKDIAPRGVHTVEGDQRARAEQSLQAGKIFGNERSVTEPSSPEGQIEELKRDFRSQSDLSEQIGKQNGGVQKLAPGELNPSYLPAVSGHYDPRTQQFVAPGNNNFDFAPKNNDYQFAGKTNPAGPYQPGISAPISFLPPENPPQESVPLPQPRPPEAPPPNGGAPVNGPRSEAAEPAQPQQLAGLGSQLVDFITNVSAALTRNKDTNVTNPAAIGVRGDAAGDDGAVTAASGGHITGPGTSTSDSIPAMLSHDEFVMKATAVKQQGVDAMYALNEGKADIVPHFAEGGSATSQGNGTKKRKKKHHSIFHPDNDGAGYGPSGESAAFAPGSGAGSGFADGGLVGRFADGGRVGSSSPSTETRFREIISRFANGGRSSWKLAAGHEGASVEHLAQGGAVGSSSAIANFRDRISHYFDGGTVSIPPLDLGMPDLKSPALAVDNSSVFQGGNQGPGMLHPVPIHFPGFSPIDGVYAKPDAVEELSRAAGRAKRFSTGTKPSWYGGGGK